MKPLFYRLTVLMSLFFISGCQSSFQNISEEDLGKIVNLRTGQQLTPSEFVAKIVSADRVLIGEQHDNLKHHQAHFWLLQELQKSRPQASVLMEMLSVDQQTAINTISATPNEMKNLPNRLNWKPSWNWAFYGEIIKTVFAQKINLVATNLTSDEVNILMTGAEPLKGFLSTEPKVKQKIADLITANHGFAEITSGQNIEIIRKMVEVQQFRDRRMAEKVLNSPTPSLLIAGNHHINRQYGVPIHLYDLSPKTEMITVILGENAKTLTAENADYFWILK